MNTQMLTKEKTSSAKSEDNDSYSMFLGDVTSLALCYYNVSFLIFFHPFSWHISVFIQLIFNNLGFPLVDHPSLYLSVYPIEHPFLPILCVGEANIALFKGLFHINATRILTAELLMWWQQLPPQIFQDFSLYFVFAMLICACRTSRNVLLDDRLPIWTSAWFIQGGISLRHAFLCHYVLK